MKKTLIFGNNDCGQLAKFYLQNDSSHEFAAFCIDDEFQTNKETFNWSLVKKKFSPSDYNFFIPLYDNKLRKEKTQEVKKYGYDLISYVSSKAIVFSSIGENCFIMENNTIQPFVSVGNNIIMWSGNHIGHHSKINDNVFFSSHVVLSGHCNVESYSWFGVNSTIRNNIKIAEGTFVAMSSSIVSDTEPYKKYMGNPARAYGDVDRF